MSLLPSLRGVIDRRILVNFRLDPEPLADLLPDGFEPRTVDGVAIGGICCIRLTSMRPAGFPAVCGLASENAAHRIGVAYETDRGRESGVYVPRRDTDSRLNRFVGRRTVGRQSLAEFDVAEGDGRYELSMRSLESDVSMHVSATEAETLPDDSVFESVAEASAYHRCGAVGYCPTPDGEELAGVELDTDEWGVTPLAVESVGASLFETSLPDDAVAFDNALLMEDIGHAWRPRATRPASA
ncbi:DUF2071 domain-containing protein [Haloglomus litoreum]|uniref:DUF2071 domain-containing protein n=1 Tax=Haloglomus litoreum TaxID=3034026 RepID=UPI0023E80217|nr:DUF2071 domain-containing protein [Haloglomus sp. DT116]